jgi:hypothetical protein
MMDITDAEDAYLSGHSEFMEWQAEFQALWYGPLMMSTLRALMGTLPPEVHSQLRSHNPQAYDTVMQMMGGSHAKRR